MRKRKKSDKFTHEWFRNKKPKGKNFFLAAQEILQNEEFNYQILKLEQFHSESLRSFPPKSYPPEKRKKLLENRLHFVPDQAQRGFREAIIEQDYKTVENTLRKRKVDVDFFNNHVGPPLMWACIIGYRPIVELLIQRKASLRWKKEEAEEEEDTLEPIFLANPNIEILSLLLLHGYISDTQTFTRMFSSLLHKQNMTVLLAVFRHCILFQYEEAVFRCAFLFHILGISSLAPLIQEPEAVLHYRRLLFTDNKIQRYVLSFATPDFFQTLCETKESPLVKAVEKNRVDILKLFVEKRGPACLLIKIGSTIFLKDRLTLVDLAIRAGHLPIFYYLQENSPHLFEGIKPWKMIIRGIEQSQTKKNNLFIIVRELLSHSPVCTTYRTSEGKNIFHILCQHPYKKEDTQFVDELLRYFYSHEEHKHLMEEPDKFGFSPIDDAVSCGGNLCIVEFFNLHFGIESLQGNKNCTLAHQAAAGNYVAILNYLKKVWPKSLSMLCEKKRVPPIVYAVSSGALEAFVWLVENCPKTLEFSDHNGRTLLHAMAAKCIVKGIISQPDMQIIHILNQKLGINAYNKRDNRGQTPLELEWHYFNSSQNRNIVKLLSLYVITFSPRIKGYESILGGFFHKEYWQLADYHIREAVRNSLPPYLYLRFVPRLSREVAHLIVEYSEDDALGWLVLLALSSKGGPAEEVIRSYITRLCAEILYHKRYDALPEAKGKPAVLELNPHQLIVTVEIYERLARHSKIDADQTFSRFWSGGQREQEKDPFNKNALDEMAKWPNYQL